MARVGARSAVGIETAGEVRASERARGELARLPWVPFLIIVVLVMVALLAHG